jgi:hypothetical protein
MLGFLDGLILGIALTLITLAGGKLALDWLDQRRKRKG